MTTNAKTGKPFPRGAKPTPRHKLLSTFPHTETVPTPPMTAYVPPELSFWGNQTDGDCVTAEEAFAKACANPEIFVTEATAVAWATEYGYLNGADLTDVMDRMAKDGFDQSGTVYGDGGYTGVDYSNELILKNAVSIAPVKVAIDADALPSTAGNQNGWYSLGGTKKFTNTDHCVSICGYGTATELFAALNVPLPSGLPGTTTGYLLFTWSTIGFVDYPWIMSTVAEAWLRNPTSIVNGVPIPNPGQNPTPSPTPTPEPVPTPTPTPGPTPTPSPTPVPSGSITSAGYDIAVGEVETDNPRIAKAIIAPVAAAIRAKAFPAGSKKKAAVKLGASSGWTPSPQLLADLDAAFTAAAAADPQHSAEILAAKAMMDMLAPLL